LSWQAAFLFGTLGAFAAELVSLRAMYQDRPREWSRFRKRPGFWILALIYILVGGGVVAAMNASLETELVPLVALNLGATWPFVLERVHRTLPAGDPGTVS